MANNSNCSKSGCDKESCAGCSENKKSLLVEQGPFSNVKNVIGVVSGKGGVGKSMVTASCAVTMAKKGYKVGIMDADITGPSIPMMFGLDGMAVGDENGIYPTVTESGIKIMSINLLMQDAESPVIWRGPVIANMVKQFWSEVMWGDLDYLFVDMPPGTGDVPLTIFQSLPVSGTILVTSPQELVAMIVKKAYNMAKMMDIPMLGVIENYSYIECPDCGRKIEVFGKSKLDSIAAEINLPVLGKLPMLPEIAKTADEGKFDGFDNKYIEEGIKALEKLVDNN